MYTTNRPIDLRRKIFYNKIISSTEETRRKTKKKKGR